MFSQPGFKSLKNPGKKVTTLPPILEWIFRRRVVTAVCQVDARTLFNASGDKEGMVNYGKRLLVCSGNQIKEIVLTKPCLFSRSCTENLVLCGGLGAIVIVNLDLGQQVGVLPFSDSLSLQHTCAVRNASNEMVILSRSTEDGQHRLMEYKCDQTGRVQSTDHMKPLFPNVTSVCASRADPRNYLVSYEGQATYLFRYPHLQAKSIINSVISHDFPHAQVVARPEGGFIFKDRTTHSIAVMDESGRTHACWNRSDDSSGQHLQLEIADWVVLSDDETVLLNFRNSEDVTKIGVIKIPSNPTIGQPISRLQLRFYETHIPIHQIAVDEANKRVIVVTTQSTVMEITQFPPLLEASTRRKEKESAISQELVRNGLRVDAINDLVHDYRRPLTW